MAKQVRSLLNIEDISLDPRIGIAMQFAAKDRKNICFFFNSLGNSLGKPKISRWKFLNELVAKYGLTVSQKGKANQDPAAVIICSSDGMYFDTTNLLNLMSLFTFTVHRNKQTQFHRKNS